MNSVRAGVLSMVLACTIWGTSPLFYKLLADVPALEVLAHRMLWSLVFFAGVLAVQRRLSGVGHALRNRRTALTLAFSAVMISVNWFLFIFSIQIAHATEASLGYYMFPLVAVLLGVAVFGERLQRLEMAAVAIAAAAVTLLAWREGHLPYVSLALAITFGFYGLAKKRLSTGAIVSVTTEVTLLTPLALGWLIWLHMGQGTGIWGHDARATILLMLSGPITAAPLILFSYASQRVALSTVGLIQYLNPTLQFLCATLVFREPFGLTQAVSFALIWTALALYSAARFGAERKRRRASVSSVTDPQT